MNLLALMYHLYLLSEQYSFIIVFAIAAITAFVFTWYEVTDPRNRI